MKKTTAILAASATIALGGCGPEANHEQQGEALRPNTTPACEPEDTKPKSTERVARQKPDPMWIRDRREGRILDRMSRRLASGGIGFAQTALAKVDKFDSKGEVTPKTAREQLEGEITVAVIDKADRDGLNYDPAGFASAAKVFGLFDEKGKHRPVQARDMAEEEAATDLANTGIIENPGARFNAANFKRAIGILSGLVDYEGRITPVEARDVVEQIMIQDAIWEELQTPEDTWKQAYKAARAVDNMGDYQSNNAVYEIEDVIFDIEEQRQDDEAARAEAYEEGY